MFRKLAGLTAVAGLFFVGTASADIATSVHNFSDNITSVTDTCSVCHTPHAADTTVSSAPLWDHTLTTASATYVPYPSTGGTLDGGWSANGASRLCLSCHDGTVAIDSYGGQAGAVTITDARWATGVGIFGLVDLNFTTEHPIGSNPTADAAVNDTPTDPAVQYFGGTVECMSCHDVHDQGGAPSLLVMPNTNSALCLACHIK